MKMSTQQRAPTVLPPVKGLPMLTERETGWAAESNWRPWLFWIHHVDSVRSFSP